MRIKRKLDTWLWFIISLLPVLFTIIYSLAIQDTTANFTFSSLISNLTNILPNDGILYYTFKNIIGYFTENAEIVSINLLCGYAAYILLAKFMHIVVDVLAFLIILAEKLIDKAGGQKLND